jgi:hypothetical protein
MKATVNIHLASRDATVSCEFDDSQLRSDFMAKFDDLKNKIDQVGSTLGAEHAEVAAAVDALNTTIADLRTQLGEMLTPEQFATLESSLDALNDQASHIYDAPSTPPPVVDEPPPAPELPPVE